MKYPAAIESLISRFRLLPGVGPKSAERFVVHLLRVGDGAVSELIAGLEGIRACIVRCAECGMFTDDVACTICRDPRRDRSTICVVAEPADLLAIERTHEYRGVYYILNGLLAPIEGVGPEQLRIAELITRVQGTVEGDLRAFKIDEARSRGASTARGVRERTSSAERSERRAEGRAAREDGFAESQGGATTRDFQRPQEVIFAFDPTIEGETTMAYIAERLAPTGVHMSRIARGLPVGGDLEYADPITLTDALTGRRALPHQTAAPSTEHQIPNNIHVPIRKR